MNRIVFLAVAMGAVLTLATACTKEGANGAAGSKTEQKQAHSDAAADAAKEGIALAIKEKKLNGFKKLTIGEAFENYRYFDKKEWKENRTPNGKIYVDFWGWFKDDALDATSRKNGVVARGVAVKFVVNPEGDFYLAMISKAETGADGKEQDYPVGDKQAILNAIYANKEISF